MTSWAWLLAVALAGQSLAEVAEREKKRREKNAEAGVEIVTYTSTGEELAPAAPEPEPETAGDQEQPDSGESDDASPLEEARERGRELEPLMAEISAMADRVDALYQRYMDTCYDRWLVGQAPAGIGAPATPPPPVHAGAGRDWLVVLETPSAFTTPVSRGAASSIVLVEPPQCQYLREDLFRSADRVRSAMQALLDRARRERILPGVVRELREKYRLEWSGWER